MLRLSARRSEVTVLALVAVAGAYGLLSSCSSDAPPAQATDAGVDAGAEVAVEAPKFSPAGCAYAVTAPNIPDFPPFDKHADTVSAAPDLRYVRRGIGGHTSAGTAGYADPATSFAIGWQTDFATLASRMRYGSAADKLDKTADGFSYLVLPDPLKSGPPEGVRFHEVHVCGLEPQKTYYYQVGGGPAGKEVWGPVLSLTTAPAKASTDKIQFGIAGDSREPAGSTQAIWKAVTKRIQAAGAGVAITTGDSIFFGYDQDLWNTWSKATSDAGSSVFFAMTLGNHEGEFIRNYGHSLMPTSGTPNSERYGSFDWGPVHFVMLDDYYGVVAPSADESGTYRPEVIAWLDSDLEKANKNRAAVPWIVTYHHHPIYSSTNKTDRATESAKVKAAFGALYDKHHVSLDVAGHDHFYERNQAVKADKVDAAGTVYLICAAAGAPAYGTIAGNPFSAKIEHYDPTVGQGIYAIGTADTASFKLTVYKMANAAVGSSPADDTVVETYDFTK